MYSSSTSDKAALRAVPQGLFPTMETLQSVVDLARTQLPITNANQLHSLLMTYHNTLLHVQTKSKEL